jgi:C4-dicarboxylate-specific signal transduction histidine kinase
VSDLAALREPLLEEEVTQLRACLNDLVSTMALPALWAGGEPTRIVDTLLDALMSMLRLTVVFARVRDPDTGHFTDVMRIAAAVRGTSPAGAIESAVVASLGSARALSATRLPIADLEMSIASALLGLDGEIGTVVVASERGDFPVQTERLLLDVAVNQAAMGLQQAMLLRSQKRIAEELDARVARRTTELATAEDALRALHLEMSRAAQVATVGELAASIAHEVNQPLSGIITNAGTCLRMLGTESPNVEGARETARRTLRDGRRAADVIARLRALFGRKEFSVEPMDLNEATREVIALSGSDLRRNRVALQSQLDDDLPPVVADRIQLQQVILNLLRNASDAVAVVDDRPRRVLVRTECEGEDRVRVTIQDSGVGIDRERAERLFDAFYTTKSDGMGIGLSISRSIVHRHHGRIWASPNEDGSGSTFAFSIPCRPGAPEGPLPGAF